ncbi:MAG: formate dehydrogenase subunit delta [Xanthobacteraceae bacterium]|nr:formate dehydrogenase subunit delta [Xanthobacteraceae bacterium]
MSHSAPDKLVYMANQIGKFFKSQGEAKTVAGVSEHIKKFWDPRMRSQIYAHIDSGGAGLEPQVKAAIEKLKNAETAAK